MMIHVQFTLLDDRAIAPRQAYDHDAGWDLYTLETTPIPAGVPTDVRTGIAVAIPDGYYGRIIHRSSTPRRRGLLVLEGIIDAGFRGELFACAWRWDVQIDASIAQVKAGESIAQLIVQKVNPIWWVQKPTLPASQRGEKGFGSSGA